jgi:hypothetical protein
MNDNMQWFLDGLSAGVGITVAIIAIIFITIVWLRLPKVPESTPVPPEDKWLDLDGDIEAAWSDYTHSIWTREIGDTNADNWLEMPMDDFREEFPHLADKILDRIPTLHIIRP